MEAEKCIIVEGRSDVVKIRALLAEQVEIICTYGTKDEEAMIELLEPYEAYELYTFFDHDYTGDYLRKMIRRAYSEAVQFDLPDPYMGVAEAPDQAVRDILATKFQVK